MKKELKRRHLIGFVLLGVLVAILILGGIITGFAYSNKVALTFQIEETGEKLDGVLYQGFTELGRVKDGKINLIWQTFYPGEIKFFLNEIEEPFLFELTINSISQGTQDYYLSEYQISDIGKGIEDYNLQFENEEIIRKINIQRETEGNNALSVDLRLNEIAKNFARAVVDGRIDREDIASNEVTNKLLEKKIFFYGSTSYWYDYTINSTMNLSEEFLDNIKKEKYWADLFFSKYPTHIGVATECNAEKRCFTLAINSKNSVSYENTLRNKYLVPHDVYYSINFNDVNINYESPVRIIFNANKNAKVYLVNSSEDYEKIVNRRSYNKIFEITSANFSREVTIRPNNTIVVHADYGEIKYTLEVWENSL